MDKKYIDELLELSDEEFADRWKHRPDDLLELIDWYNEEKDIGDDFIILIKYEIYKDQDGNYYELEYELDFFDTPYYYHFIRLENYEVN